MKQKQIEQSGKLLFVRLGQMAIPTLAQRDFRPHRAEKIFAEFDIDRFGVPALSFRGGVYYIIDGQHRIEAIKRWIGQGWEDQRIECRVFEGLTEAQEADYFLKLSDTLPIATFDRFRIAVNAGYHAEVEIKRVVEQEGLRIAKNKGEGNVQCVGTLKKVYARSDAKTLAKTLRIVRDAFGDTAMQALVIDGIAHFVQRYDRLADETLAKHKLGQIAGGLNGFLNRAAQTYKQLGGQRSHCVAATAVDIYNRQARKNQKLPNWW